MLKTNKTFFYAVCILISSCVKHDKYEVDLKQLENNSTPFAAFSIKKTADKAMTWYTQDQNLYDFCPLQSLSPFVY